MGEMEMANLHWTSVAVGFFCFGAAVGLFVGMAFGTWSRGVDEQDGRDM